MSKTLYGQLAWAFKDATDYRTRYAVLRPYPEVNFSSGRTITPMFSMKNTHDEWNYMVSNGYPAKLERR